jgi:Regulator of chromosome condensation (RCC1) repeat
MRKPIPTIVAALTFAFLAACSSDPSSPPITPPITPPIAPVVAGPGSESPSPPTPSPQIPSPSVVGDAVQIVLSGVDNAQPTVTATSLKSSPSQSSGLQSGLNSQAVTNAKNVTIGTNASVRSSTDIITPGQARSTGFRYLHVTLPVSVTGSSVTNLTLLGLNATGNLAGSAVKSIDKYPGSSTAYTATELSALAASLTPTSPVTLDPIKFLPALVSGEEDALQIYNESEITPLTVSGGSALPYGFVAHAGSSRVIPVGTETGTVTLALRLPLQATAKEDPFSITLTFLPVQDSATFVTESLQAQLPLNQAKFEKARARVAGSLRVMPGTAQTNALAVCKVRSAGSTSSPSGYLINRVPTSVANATQLIGKGQTLNVGVKATDAVGDFFLPAQTASVTDSSLATTAVSALTGVSKGMTDLTSIACGVKAATTSVRVLARTTIAASFYHSLALKSDGSVTGWGGNTSGQTTIPTGLTNVTAIAAGSNHSLALTSDGTVIGWGYNADGQTTIPTGLTNVTAIAAGSNHSLALKSDGSVTGWGRNTEGQTTIPTGLTNVTAIAAGSAHSLALKSDGTVIGWGYNADGQTTIPTGLTNVTAIAVGGNHSLALKSDGTVIGWGNNTFGQTTIPTGLTNVTAIAAGSAHSLALKSDGTVIGWGYNTSGQTTIPTGLTNVTAIAVGGNHSLALKSDGSVTGWGRNTDGQTAIPSIAPLTFMQP